MEVVRLNLVLIHTILYFSKLARPIVRDDGESRLFRSLINLKELLNQIITYQFQIVKSFFKKPCNLINFFVVYIGEGVTQASVTSLAPLVYIKHGHKGDYAIKERDLCSK